MLSKSDGRFVFRLGTREFATQQELVRVLRQFENKVDGAFVRVSDDVPFDMAAAAIQACKTARFLTVSYVPLDSNLLTRPPLCLGRQRLRQSSC